MNKQLTLLLKKKSLWGFVGIIFVGIISFLGFDELHLKYINSEIQKAKYCEVKEDCEWVSGKCPFTCGAVVNKNEAEYIEELFASYRPGEKVCTESCLWPKGVTCEENICGALTE